MKNITLYFFRLLEDKIEELASRIQPNQQNYPDIKFRLIQFYFKFNIFKNKCMYRVNYLILLGKKGIGQKNY